MDPLMDSENEARHLLAEVRLLRESVADHRRELARLRRVATEVVEAYYCCREHGSMVGFWTHLDDLAALIDGRAALSTPAPATATDPRVFWSFSSDEEHFMGDFATKEEAIAAAPDELGLFPGDRFWVGKGSFYEVTSVRVEDLFEWMIEDVSEDCGEVAEDWGPVPDEECEREVLDAVLRCLQRTKEIPQFWTVNEIEVHTAPSPSPDDATTPDRSKP